MVFGWLAESKGDRGPSLEQLPTWPKVKLLLCFFVCCVVCCDCLFLSGGGLFAFYVTAQPLTIITTRHYHEGTDAKWNHSVLQPTSSLMNSVKQPHVYTYFMQACV